VVIFLALTAGGAGIHVAAEAVVGGATQHIGALAVAIPAAGFLLGLALVMVLTGTPVLSSRVYPKWVSALALLVVAAFVSAAAVVVVCAATMAGLAALVVIVGPLHPGDASDQSARPSRA
jgi:hypothetical protein